MTADLEALVLPAYHSAPPYTVTIGPEVADLADSAGMTLDGLQRAALDDIFALGPRGGWASISDATVCDRQNIKTWLLEAAVMGKTALGLDQLTTWTAHEYPTAVESFRRIKGRYTDYDHLRKLVAKVYDGKGDEALEFTNGARLIFRARTKHGGRGLTGDTVVIDEAQKLTAAHMGAMVPTISTRKRAQLLYGGTAGDLYAEVWRGIRNRGRAGTGKRLSYREWCAEERACLRADCTHAFGVAGCALDDRELWRQANPSLDLPGRVRSEVVETERESMPPREFMRERLGWWEDPPTGGGVIDLEVWASLAAGVKQMRRAALAVEVALDRSQATIGTAWRRGSPAKPHVEIVEERAGTTWVVDRVIELARRYESPAVVLDAQSEAAGFATDLEAAGVPVVLATAADRLAACGAFYDLATGGGLTHSGDPAMATAIAAAQWKDVGDGGRVFARRKSAASIAPLYAVTFALHGLLTEPEGDGYVL